MLKTSIAYFSPTHTSRNIARAVAKGYSKRIAKELDTTLTPLAPTEFAPTDLLIVSVPVYGSAVAPIALKRLDQLRGNNTPAVAIVLYGNRDFGHAPTQLADFLKERGFCVVGAAAYVGEHSYSTPERPIAAGRPNHSDLNEALNFGLAIREKMEQHSEPLAVDCSQLKCPPSNWLSKLRFIAFVLSYRRRMKKHPVKIVPVTNEAVCTQCGACARICPTGAISADSLTETDASKCIKCAACVKGCPQHARKLNTPFAAPLARNFKQPKPNVSLI